MSRRSCLSLLILAAAACSGDASDPGPAPTAVPAAGALAPSAPLPPTAANPPNTATPTGAATPTQTGAAGVAGVAAAAPSAAPPAPSAPAANSSGAAGASSTANDPAACRGFSFEGLIYSPGGTALPNNCEPFHPTTNNPYAVRCVDAWPWYKTKYPGDNFCILPPPPDKGVQYGVHPQGKKWFEQVSKGDMSGYDNLSEQWTMQDGDEEQANYQTSSDNPMPANYYRAYARMRQGSHHMIVSSMQGGAPETWGPALSTGLASLSLPGAQRPDENAPKSLEKPAEDKGLYSKLPANAPITFNMHHFNASGKTILKEAWSNLWWETDATIELKGILGLELGQTATLAVQPGAVADLHYSWRITQPVRLVTAFGHRHAWTSNFSSWIENQDGKLDILYQSYNWLDEPTYRYDSMTQNPAPAPDNRSDGASSGLRMLMPGQKLHFNCHIEYTDARAKSEGAPMPNEIGTLHFANEAFSAEMCILFGSTAATQLLTPQVETSKLPDFATN